MVVETEDPAIPVGRARSPAAHPRQRRRAVTVDRAANQSATRQKRRWFRAFPTFAFSTLTRRIVVLNLTALATLVSGILVLNQFREGLIDAKVESLFTQGELIASAIAVSAANRPGRGRPDLEALLQMSLENAIARQSRRFADLDFPINPERVTPTLRRLISTTGNRARVFGRDGDIIVDTAQFLSRGDLFDTSETVEEPEDQGLSGLFTRLLNGLFRRSDLPVYTEPAGADDQSFTEVATALDGAPSSIVRVNQGGEMIVFVSVPIRRHSSIIGALLLSTPAGDIDTIIMNERIAIMRVFAVAAIITIGLSVLLAGTIAGPVRRLASAAERVRKGVKSREEIPDFPDRQDEIGHLARALRHMTNSLYDRIAAIESFAADVSHELKNPLTSLRSAVETLPLARTEESRKRLIDIVQHDVRRLDRLISDISDASRLDAELARLEAEPVDLAGLVDAVVSISNDLRHDGDPVVVWTFPRGPKAAFRVFGFDSRLAQVLNNVIDNAKSFTGSDGFIAVGIDRDGDSVIVRIEDDGPGIKADAFERIFERFYTDRPEQQGFGNNSGLGLSISKQIVEAHGGSIRAENVYAHDEAGKPFVAGARFTVRLPALEPLA
ncbi:MAG: sensor histidine kinase [Pseudomonadota bacterium]